MFQARSFKVTIRIPRKTQIVAFNLKLERPQKSNCRLWVEPVGAHVQKKWRKILAAWIFDRCPVIKAICGTSILFLTIAPVKKEWPTIREGGRGIKETCDSRDYHGKREKINFLGGEIDGCFSPNETTILIYFLAGCFVFASTSISISARNVYAKFLQFSSLKR